MLREKGISCVVSGNRQVDLRNAVEQLAKHFGIRRLLIEGDGHINGGLLHAGLVDEVSLLLIPGIDGRHEIPTVFDGVSPSRKRAVPFHLQSAQRRSLGSVWLRYRI